MAALKKLPSRLPIVRLYNTDASYAIEKAHEEIIKVVNDHATAYDTSWSTTNGATVKAHDADGSLAHQGDVLASLITVLKNKGVLGS